MEKVFDMVAMGYRRRKAVGVFSVLVRSKSPQS